VALAALIAALAVATEDSSTTLAGPPDPAPPLSEADLQRLHDVEAWDIIYTHTFAEFAAGSGDLSDVSLPPSTWPRRVGAWNSVQSHQYTFSTSFTVAGMTGPSDCSSSSGSFRCVAKYEYPAMWTASDSLSSMLAFQEACQQYPQEPVPDTPITKTESWSSGGSRQMTGVDSTSIIGWSFVIDYSVNPPVVSASSIAAPFLDTTIRHTEGGCFNERDDDVFDTQHA